MSEVIQASFAKALLDLDRSVPEGLRSHGTQSPERRFRIYRNNVGSGLIRALSTRFPATERIVGADFFAAMGQAFIRRHPPRSPLLFEYGDEFADFVERFEPAAGLIYLPDVIRLEAARSRAYHAPDAVPIEHGVFAALPPDRLPGLGLHLHPSASVVRSAHPVVTIWAMNSGDAVVEPIVHWTAEQALVTRPFLTVLVHRLSLGGGAFVESLRAGAKLETAVEVAMKQEPTFDLTVTLACTLQSGLFIAVTA